MEQLRLKKVSESNYKYHTRKFIRKCSHGEPCSNCEKVVENVTTKYILKHRGVTVPIINGERLCDKCVEKKKKIFIDYIDLKANEMANKREEQEQEA